MIENCFALSEKGGEILISLQSLIATQIGAGSSISHKTGSFSLSIYPGNKKLFDDPAWTFFEVIGAIN